MSMNRTRGPAGGPARNKFQNDTISNTAPFRPIQPSLQAQRGYEARRLRRQRYAQRIWRLGERVEFELVEHLITAFALDEDAVDRVLDRFARLDHKVLKVLGADRLPPSPTREVQ